MNRKFSIEIPPALAYVGARVNALIGDPDAQSLAERILQQIRVGCEIPASVSDQDLRTSVLEVAFDRIRSG